MIAFSHSGNGYLIIRFRNPRQGVIINRPNGTDVYSGVLKDYTGSVSTIHNYYNFIIFLKLYLVEGKII